MAIPIRNTRTSMPDPTEKAVELVQPKGLAMPDIAAPIIMSGRNSGYVDLEMSSRDVSEWLNEKGLNHVNPFFKSEKHTMNFLWGGLESALESIRGLSNENPWFRGRRSSALVSSKAKSASLKKRSQAKAARKITRRNKK